MAVIYTPHFMQFFDDDGNILSGGKLYTYAAGTTTLKSTYTTSAGDVENANPVVLDSSGRAVLFISGAYKFSLYDSDDNLIRTTDNITSFTTTEEGASAYFESFSGDGTTTDFTTSQDLGTDEKLIMIFVDDGVYEIVSNGDFASADDWTLGTGWSIGSGVATATGAISTSISQTAQFTIEEGYAYSVTYTITRTAGGLIPNIGGTNGTKKTSSGTYSETIICGSTQTIAFGGNGFTGTLDNVSVKPVYSKGFDILATDQYTIDGTDLTISEAPKTGENNIQVWAPSLLAVSASTSAAAAEESAAAAATSAVVSATYAASASESVTDTSTTSITIGTGSTTFTVSSGKSFIAGMYLAAYDQADSDNYMLGYVTSYSGTSLTIMVQSYGGSGTISAWNIVPSSPPTTNVKSIKQQIFTTTGTYTRDPNLLYAVVECIGGGAGGGGNATNGGGTGGGGGAYAKVLLTAAEIGASQTVTIGAGGSGGAAGDNDGTDGGTTSLGTLCVAGGGIKGSGTTTTTEFKVGGNGGTPITGDVLMYGGNGGPNQYNVNNGGMGGANGLGGGGGNANTGGAGRNGLSYGSGGGAGGGGSYAGGNGRDGLCVVTEYCTE